MTSKGFGRKKCLSEQSLNKDANKVDHLLAQRQGNHLNNTRHILKSNTTRRTVCVEDRPHSF